MSYTPIYYADMYVIGGGVSTTITTAGTFYPVASGFSNTVAKGFTFSSNSTLTCNVAGTYRIVWSMSIETASTSQGLLGGIMKNATVAANGQGYDFQSTANFPVTVCGSLFVTLAVNDTLKFAVTDATSAKPVITTYASLTILEV